jgi:hypothetical protein
MKLSGAERFVAGARMFESVRAIVLASLPGNISETERKRMLYERFYGLPHGAKQVYRAGTKRRRKQGISENDALEKGLKEKSAEFVKKGAEVYAKA